MTWGRVSNPHEIVHIDQQLEVYVISVDKDREKSHSVLSRNPKALGPALLINTLLPAATMAKLSM